MTSVRSARRLDHQGLRVRLHEGGQGFFSSFLEINTHRDLGLSYREDSLHLQPLVASVCFRRRILPDPRANVKGPLTSFGFCQFSRTRLRKAPVRIQSVESSSDICSSLLSRISHLASTASEAFSRMPFLSLIICSSLINSSERSRLSRRCFLSFLIVF